MSRHSLTPIGRSVKRLRVNVIVCSWRLVDYLRAGFRIIATDIINIKNIMEIFIEWKLI